jgi:soluble lytic murein transglycosylase-like protein
VLDFLKKSLGIATLLAFSLSAAKPATADIFYFVAEDGTSHFSDQASDSRYRLFLHDKRKTPDPSVAKISYRGTSEAKRHLDREILAAAQANRIDVALLHSVIAVESGYNPKAISPKGALGLMQLMPDTARRYRVTDPLDVKQNLQGGARLLHDLLDIFSGDKQLALAAYNAGIGTVMAHGRRIPPYPETARYVPAVLQRYEQLRNSAQMLAD